MENNCTNQSCAVLTTLQLVGNKWVLVILSRLLEGTKRFGELQKEIESISPKVLTQQLRKMEKEGLVQRKVYPEIPPKVEYSLTQKGKALEPVFLQIIDWGNEYCQ
jgi:DNA-binding HxlR family transcriptional regulator